MKFGQKLTGLEKAAVLMLCLSERQAAKIFEELDDDEVRSISKIMMEIDHIPPAVSKQVLEDFQKIQKEEVGIFVEGSEFVRRTLSAAEDRDRAENLMDQLISGAEGKPLETISNINPRMVASLIEREHPQTIALILSTQSEEHTSRILSNLPSDVRAEVMYRIAKIDQVSPEVVGQIEDTLRRELGVVVGREQRQMGGVDKVVDILGSMGKNESSNILTSIEATDPDMAEEIRKLMFTFDAVAELDTRALQTILREVNTESLTLALKTAPDTVKDKIFANISERAAEMIEEDLEAMGPVRLSEVEVAQQSIVKIALKLEEEGRLVIPGKGGDDALV